MAETTYYGQKIENEQPIYELGATIELMLQVETSSALEIGNEVAVNIYDIFDNPIIQGSALLVGDNLYVAEIILSNEIINLYNINNELEDESIYDSRYFYLKDSWVFPNGSTLEFTFRVIRAREITINQKDSLFSIEIDNINGEGINRTIRFTTEIQKYYASIEDVILNSPATFDLDPISIVRNIMKVSEEVDVFMRPNKIYNLKAYNAAVKCFVSKRAAYDLIKEDIVGIDKETKSLDSFTVSRSYNAKRIKSILDDMNTCALIIYAGGLDTPFTPGTFEKGLYDPNRPNIARANIDLSGDLPWVNFTTSRSLVMLDNGTTVELRGTRTIAEHGDFY